MKGAGESAIGSASLYVVEIRSAKSRGRAVGAARPKLEAELKAVEKKISKAESALDRYFRAFESGSLTEDQCATRIQALTLESTDLKLRRDELADELAADVPKARKGSLSPPR